VSWLWGNLNWVVFAPLIGAAVILRCPRTAVQRMQRIALVTTGLTLLLSLGLLTQFEAGEATLQLEQLRPWIPAVNIWYHLGIDGISLPLVLLTALLAFLACVGSLGITERVKEYFVLYLLLETGMLGTFVALDLFLFYIFWEVVLVPMYFLIGIWGGGRREYSAMKFFLYTLAGSLAMLLGILAVYLHTGSFDLIALRERAGADFPLGLQQVLFLAFFLAFAVKVPVFPFHTWLPDAHVDAPTPISVLLAGVLLKMGGYGFFRISYPLFPDGARWFVPATAILALINILYGALVAMAQTDFKRLVAYSSVSHMGFVLLGLASLTETGLQGGLLQMVSHGLITGGMFFLVGVLYDRTHTRDLTAFGGLGAHLPLYAGLLTFFALASLGLPGLSGFVSEFLSLLGAFPTQQLITALAIVGIVLTAGYMLLMLQRVLLGPRNPRWHALPDMTRRELVTLVPLLLLIAFIGLYPWSVLRLQAASLAFLLRLVGGAS